MTSYSPTFTGDFKDLTDVSLGFGFKSFTSLMK